MDEEIKLKREIETVFQDLIALLKDDEPDRIDVLKESLEQEDVKDETNKTAE